MSYCDIDEDNYDFDDYDNQEYELDEGKGKDQVKFNEKDTYLACENNLYELHPADVIIENIKQSILVIAEDSGISKGRAFLVLRACKYDKSQCQTIPKNIIDDVFFQESNDLYKLKNTKECLLCFEGLDQNNKYSLDCQHNFCKECFGEYIKACLKEGQGILQKTCPMDKCRERIGLDEFKIFLKSSKERNLYHKFLLNDVFQNTQLVVQCPHSNCDKVFDFGKNKQVEALQLNLKCACEKGYFCSQCKDDAHFPCSCDMLKKWNELIQGKNTEDMNTIWLQLNTKSCPKCKVLIEKNKGCMHMNCKNCNFHFCWLCMGEYVNHNDYYSCNKYNKEDEKQMTNEEQKLKKYEFFTDRFKDHLGAVKLTMKEANSQINNFKNEIQFTDIKKENFKKEMEFYVNAYDILIEAKKCIAYTYPIGYYIENRKREYFEFLQGQLEQNLNPFEELLSLVLFQDLLQKDDNLFEFYNYKTLVVEKTTKIKHYLCSMIKDLSSELPELDLKQLSVKLSQVKSHGSMKQESSKHTEQNVLLCDQCLIQPVENDYGLCGDCLNVNYEYYQ